MRSLMLILIVLMGAGCQLDIQGPSGTAKIFYPSENDGQVYKSRSSGMTGGNEYSSHGLNPTGSSGSVARWGTLK